MSTFFEIESFDEYLQTVRNEPPDDRIYSHGQSRFVSDGHPHSWILSGPSTTRIG